MGTRPALFLAGAFLALALPPALSRAQTRPLANGPALIGGLVFDSLSSHVLANAAVQLVAESTSEPRRVYNVRSDSEGRYRSDSLVAGVYVIGFAHPLLDSLGIEAPLRRVVIAAGATTRLDLAVPGAPTIVRAACPSDASERGAALLMGDVRDASTGAPQADVDVVAKWSELSVVPNGTSSRASLHSTVSHRVARTTNTGRFVFCGLPIDAELAVRAATGAPSVSTIDSLATGWLSLSLRPASVTRLHVFVGGASVASGRLRIVVRGSDGRALSNAQASVLGAMSRGTTGENGAVVLTALPTGSQTLDVRALGYLPMRSVVNVGVGRNDVSGSVGHEAELAVTLTPVRSGLDTVRVIASLRDGFRERRARGHGRFLDRGDLERRPVVALTDALQRMPALHVSFSLFEKRVWMYQLDGLPCVPTVWIDAYRQLGREIDLEARLAEIDAVEVYMPEQVPREFASNDRCGAIVIWTNRNRR